MTAGVQGLITAKTLCDPTPRNPVVLCGLPGSGYVGKLAAEHLISVFDAKMFKEFESPSFPPQAIIEDDGTAHPARAEYYYADTHQENDLLIFTADAQPSTSRGEYELTSAIIEEGKRLGARLVISLAAYITGGFAESPGVFGASSSAEVGARLTENGVKLMKEGTVTGMNGLVIGMAAISGMDGFCLLGETSGYMVDPAASQHVLEALSRILKMKVDLSTLSERANEAKELMSQIQRMTEADQLAEEARQGGQRGQPGYIG